MNRDFAERSSLGNKTVPGKKLVRAPAPAKLYLDDISEILQILDRFKPGLSGQLCRRQVEVRHAGRSERPAGTHHPFRAGHLLSGKAPRTLELTPSATRIHIHEIGDQLPAWSKYVNVAAIFEKRRLRLKSARGRIPGSVVGVCGLVAGGGCSVAICPARRQTRVTLQTTSHRDRFHARAVAVVYYFVVRTALFTCAIPKGWE